MRTSLLLLLSLLLLAAFSVGAQDPEIQKPQCFEPTAQTFDEFVLTTPQDLMARAKQFEDKLRENAESQGVIFVYGGKKSKLNEISEMLDKVRKAFKGQGYSYESKISARDGGYRAEPTLVFMLRPLRCTEQPVPSPDLAADQVDFSDLPAAATVRMASSDLYAAQVHEPAAECPPAAAAVRACVEGTETEVFVIVDAAGAVIFARTESAHPLLRTSAVAIAKKWYFRPYSDKSGKPLNRSGVIVIRYVGPKDALTTND